MHVLHCCLKTGLSNGNSPKEFKDVGPNHTLSCVSTCSVIALPLSHFTTFALAETLCQFTDPAKTWISNLEEGLY